MGKYGGMGHSRQMKYIESLDFISQLYLDYYPHKKEDLSISIKFENEDELFEIEYSLEKFNYFSEEFKNFYLEEKKKCIKNNIPLIKFEEIEKKFKKKKGLINNLKNYEDEDMWDLTSYDEYIKCRVDEENHFNVLYQSSFSPDDYNDYEEIMYECFSRFYSNDYKIIIIEDKNSGGKTELCFPFTIYLRPKIPKHTNTAMKSTKLILQKFFMNDENLNPETCFPYTEKDDILNGAQDTYNDGINEAIHKRTKEYEQYNIYEKKIMEKKRKEYLSSGKTKKPTEIIVFTDGYSFSCASDFIRGLQAQGHGIIVGYNARPDINISDFDASQSNSGGDSFEISENAKNLKELGFDPYITFTEHFDPNDKGNPKTPMEFLVYPVDEISTIYHYYDDDIYYRFIKESERIFAKYNNLENGECNPDNKLLYYETSNCDSKINIDKAHGGYICGDDGKWDQNKCIPAYCDDGFYLNDDRTKCIPEPCDNIILNEIIINEEKESKYTIKPNNTYIFTIENDNSSYYFYSELEPFFYIMNEHHILEAVKNGKEFKDKDKIYVNYFVNITKDIIIRIKTQEDETSDVPSDVPSDNPSDESNKPINDNDGQQKEGLSTGIIVLIVVCSIIVALAIIIIIIIFVISRKRKLSNKDIEEKSQQLNPINNLA